MRWLDHHQPSGSARRVPPQRERNQRDIRRPLTGVVPLDYDAESRGPLRDCVALCIVEAAGAPPRPLSCPGRTKSCSMTNRLSGSWHSPAHLLLARKSRSRESAAKDRPSSQPGASAKTLFARPKRRGTSASGHRSIATDVVYVSPWRFAQTWSITMVRAPVPRRFGSSGRALMQVRRSASTHSVGCGAMAGHQ